MGGTIERGLEDLYAPDGERADALVFGRKSGPSRRGFLRQAGLASMGAAVGASIPFGANMPQGLVPAALAQGVPAAAPKGPVPLDFPGKDKGLVVLGDRPLVAETPEHLLDDDTTPNSRFFIRNNGQVPEAVMDADKWMLTVDGEVNNKLEISLGDLKSKFKTQKLRMVLECGGNGRSAFQPQARGNQWTNGGAGCAEWTGVRLADVLKAAALKSTAAFTGHYGADPHLSGAAGQIALSRGMPIAKAMERHTLVVFAMNGEALPNIHGGPLRLIVPGWPGSLSHKWLNRIWVRDKEHDGQGMGGTSYRVPIAPIVPGSNADGKTNFRNLESMPVRAIISSPANGAKLTTGLREVAVRGAAWAGEYTVRAVDVSTDFGSTWSRVNLSAPKNRYDWQRWTAKVKLPMDGYYEIWARATDARGVMQPHSPANWNPQGYGGNAMQRVAVLVG